MIETRDFIERLHRGGGWGNWWTKHQRLPDKQTYWWPTDEPKEIPNGRNVNVYFGVHACRGIPDFNAKGELADSQHKRSQNAYIQQINCLFAEFDDKDFGGNDNCKAHVNVLMAKTIRELPPSFVVASGGGYHLYWLLKEPWALADLDEMEVAKRLQAQWVTFLGGDKASKDLARVLRVPGTKNFKYDPPQDVEILLSYPENEYNVGDFEKVMSTVAVTLKDPEKDVEIIESIDDTDQFARALMYLNSLAPFRYEDYQPWLEVGMALTQLGEVGLHLWDAWSKKSDKYKWGTCSAKWRTLAPGDGITIESLKYWAKEDNPEELFAIPGAPKKPKPSHYKTAIVAAGWKFRQNESNDDVELNGMRMSDSLNAVVKNAMRERGYTSVPVVDDSITELAFRNRYHPVMDYLNRLEYDGGDEIEKLASYFTGKHGVFEQWITRWLIGAIARVAAYPRGQQNRMLVLDGAQNLGKSYFVRWLASAIPQFYIESPINPEDKDDSIRLMSLWIWEVAELGSTFRKSDREALKFFISKEQIRERKPYGKYDTQRPAMASFIGTINNEAGFLDDATGSRRYMVETLSDINWAYATEVSVGQVWARAYHLFKQGESWHLDEYEAKMASEINAEYNMENPIEDYMLRHFEAALDDPEAVLTTAQIMDVLVLERCLSRNSRADAMRIGAVLRKWGCERTRAMLGGARTWRWKGVCRTNKIPEFTDPGAGL